MRSKVLPVVSLVTVALLASCAKGSQFTAVGGAGGSGGQSPAATTATGATTGNATSGMGGAATSGIGGSATVGVGGATATTATSSTAAGMGPAGLLFSEYVEGSSYNKAVEISNRGAAPASLQGCQIDHYVNGSSTASAPTVLTAMTLQPGQVFVVCHTQFSQPALCNQLDGKMTFTGNDVVALTCGGAPVDIIGRIGENMVWGSPPTATTQTTLRRKCPITSGDVNGSDPFDPAIEWNGFALDTLSDLGKDICP